jgi:hypothetical protein
MATCLNDVEKHGDVLEKHFNFLTIFLGGKEIFDKLFFEKKITK